MIEVDGEHGRARRGEAHRVKLESGAIPDACERVAQRSIAQAALRSFGGNRQQAEIEYAL
jgi:hypothetical protein